MSSVPLERRLKSHWPDLCGTRGPRSPRTPYAGLLVAMWFLTVPSTASASLLSAEAEDALANFLAIFVLFVVPVVLIVLFWMCTGPTRRA